MTQAKYHLEIHVATRYINEQSTPHEHRYVFAYTITIRNRSEKPVRLIARHWVITDSNGKVQEVRGEGVIGEQPWMQPGDNFQYTSGAILETGVGTMRGSYHMISDDGTRFKAPIPEFTLSIPRTLH